MNEGPFEIKGGLEFIDFANLKEEKIVICFYFQKEMAFVVWHRENKCFILEAQPSFKDVNCRFYKNGELK